MFQWIREFLDKCGISGSYYEFGVFNGESMCDAYYLLRDQVEKYVGFDSFEGLPEPSDIDKKSILLQPEFCKGNFKSAGFETVQAVILASGLPRDKLVLVKGFLEHTLTKDLQRQLLSSAGKASVVHLDVDFLSSTQQALDFILPFLQTGTWILCDDYWTYRGASSFGTQKALANFLSQHKDIRLQEYCSYRGWSKAFIVEKL